jgi:hypothetical protein
MSKVLNMNTPQILTHSQHEAEIKADNILKGISLKMEYVTYDAFLEYADTFGLWGFPGGEHSPLSNEIEELYDQFTTHWKTTHSSISLVGPPCKECGAPTDQDGDIHPYHGRDAWVRIANDFQNYAESNGFYEDAYSMPDDTHITNMWIQYIEAVHDPILYDIITALGDTYKWLGVYPK